ncbi:hypothetical protein U9M48_029668 [Paspalum notatum var. saurae]|uniref:Uncharacterized protein n=1 Tax=Paspalum notatum var. saurae TaxID=547442 RepID=A0AAQ3U219_PASNO
MAAGSWQWRPPRPASPSAGRCAPPSQPPLCGARRASSSPSTASATVSWKDQIQHMLPINNADFGCLTLAQGLIFF